MCYSRTQDAAQSCILDPFHFFFAAKNTAKERKANSMVKKLMLLGYTVTLEQAFA